MRGVVGWLRPGSRFAFQRQARQMHRMHRTQGTIFADEGIMERKLGAGVSGGEAGRRDVAAGRRPQKGSMGTGALGVNR